MNPSSNKFNLRKPPTDEEILAEYEPTDEEWANRLEPWRGKAYDTGIYPTAVVKEYDRKWTEFWEAENKGTCNTPGKPTQEKTSSPEGSPDHEHRHTQLTEQTASSPTTPRETSIATPPSASESASSKSHSATSTPEATTPKRAQTTSDAANTIKSTEVFCKLMEALGNQNINSEASQSSSTTISPRSPR